MSDNVEELVAIEVSDPVQEFQNWVGSLSSKQPEGCFFILNETAYPYFWGGPFAKETSLTEAWDCICDSWLKSLHKTTYPLQQLFPHILKGYVKDGVIFMGNDCPYYVSEIAFCFSIPSDSEIRIDPTLAIDLNISKELAFTMMSMIKDCPYFEKLPKRIQFHRKNYGSDVERSAAAKELILHTQELVQAKRVRPGSLPKLVANL